MQISNLILYGILELIGALLLLTIYLLIHTRGLKKLIKRMQEKLLSLVVETKRLRESQAETSANELTYETLLDQQLEQNRLYHASLNPDQDIALDLTDDVPLERQIASVRHVFLSTEREAHLSSDSPTTPHWPVIQSKLQRLLDFFRNGSTGGNHQNEARLQAEIAERDQRIEHLEQFKRRLLERETPPDKAQSEADGSHMAGGITQIVERKVPTFAPKDELEQLKSVAANQHKLIAELQERLAIAYSAADKESLITDLKHQLEQQVRFMEESETCIRLLEEELEQANLKIVNLDRDLKAASHQAPNPQQAAKTEKLLQTLQANMEMLQKERNSMIHNTQQLERENEQLMLQLQTAMRSSGEADGVKKQLKLLQQQYTELESKYLALRMTS